MFRNNYPKDINPAFNLFSLSLTFSTLSSTAPPFGISSNSTSFSLSTSLIFLLSSFSNLL